VSANNKLHERTETPNGGRSKKVQSRDGRFKPVAESRETFKATYGMCEFRVKEIVLGNIHFVSGSQKNVVNGSQASVIELNLYAPANRDSRNNRTAKVHGHALEPFD